LTSTGYRSVPASRAGVCRAVAGSTKRSRLPDTTARGSACFTPPSSCGSCHAHAIEMAPVWAVGGHGRGVVSVGPVGSPSWGRSRLFRYEVRCWRDGVIPDATTAVDSPRRVSISSSQAHDVLRLVESFPTATWGRDEQQAGEMWNSNSLTAWLLALSGHDIESPALQPPTGGRAPGWSAGLLVAARAGADQACLSEGGSAGCTDQSGGSSLPDSSSRSASAASA
jgi:hypothetical protein